ncbi:dihydrodipicolinate synthase family protein [Telmatospirillum sp. J64-1]|uniref:dihydrodipicolinate synthase family protein n=1 Tax=Telmatospirillum sp. J64-1 TaxID=2502183 RepID=UPI00115F5874|nr:dihydrodipicolinate synthase family protein [Telmatospirillum sp. J64-1]
MNRSELTNEALATSVIAVPPMALNADLSLNWDANRSLLDHLEDGGVRVVLYGGNANLYNIGQKDFVTLIDFLGKSGRPDTWLIPSVGPDYGKMMDQADILRDAAIPTAMVLPMTFPATPEGAATGIRRFADRFGKPVILYIKSATYLTPKLAGKLVADGVAQTIKYGFVRPNPAEDPFLEELLAEVDRSRVISGIGERPAVCHLSKFGLNSFTSGCVSLAPALSMSILAAVKAGELEKAEELRALFLPLEDLRDSISPLTTLHDAVTFSGIADMGPILPLLSNTDPAHHSSIRSAAQALLREEQRHRQALSAQAAQ